MIKRLKQYALIAAAAALLWFVLDNHFIIDGHSVHLLRKKHPKFARYVCQPGQQEARIHHSKRKTARSRYRRSLGGVGNHNLGGTKQLGK